MPQQCGSGEQDRRGVGGEDEDGRPLAEQLSGSGETGGVGGGGSQAAEAVFLHGGAGVRDEPEQRLGDIQQGELVLRALQAGAAGFLLKDSPPADIVRAIDSVYAGDGMLSPRITRRLINLVGGDPDAAARREQARQRLAALTPREREVAAAVADGSPNAEIATRLHMSLATVKAHVSRLLVKLDAANRVQVALLVQDVASRQLMAPHAPKWRSASGQGGCCRWERGCIRCASERSFPVEDLLRPGGDGPPCAGQLRGVPATRCQPARRTGH